MNQDLPALTITPAGALSMNRAAALCLAPEEQLDGLRVTLAYQPDVRRLSITGDPAGLFILRNVAVQEQAPTYRVHAKLFFSLNHLLPVTATRYVAWPQDGGNALLADLSQGEDASRGKRTRNIRGRRRPRISDLGLFHPLGFTMRIVRLRRDLTLEELAAKTEIPSHQLALYESGRYVPTFPELSKLLLAFELSPVAFFVAMQRIAQASAATESEPSPNDLAPFLECRRCSGGQEH